MQPQKQSTLKLRFILLGDSQVGKTSLLQKWQDPSKFDSSYIPTIGGDPLNQRVQVSNKPCELIIWGASGQDKFLDVTKAYLPLVEGVICVFDVTNKESFENVSKWVQLAKETVKEDTEYLLVGNKIDLEVERKVNYEEAAEFAKVNGMDYVEISVKDSTNLGEIQNEIIPKAIKVYERRVAEGVYVIIEDVITEKDLLEKSKGTPECSVM